jgi:hypothetical protein
MVRFVRWAQLHISSPVCGCVKPTTDRRARLVGLKPLKRGKPCYPRAEAPGLYGYHDRNYDTRDFVRELRELRVTRMWPSTPPGGPAPSMAQRRVIRAMPSVSGNAHAWKRSLGGSRRSGCCGRCGIVGLPGWDGCSPLRPPCITWCGCARWRQWHEPKGRQECRITSSPLRSEPNGVFKTARCAKSALTAHRNFCWHRRSAVELCFSAAC